MQLRGTTFVVLALGAFGLLIAGFVVRGFGRLLVGVGSIDMLAQPFFLAGFGVAIITFVLAVLVKVGVVAIDDPQET